MKFSLKQLFWFITIAAVLANLAVGIFPFAYGLYALALMVCINELWAITKE